jgi:hypothetical protein
MPNNHTLTIKELKMQSKLLIAMISVLALGFVVSPAWAEKLIIISNHTLQGEVTNEQCLEKGDQFAVIKGKSMRVLSPLEVEVLKRENPKVFQMPAYSMPYMEQAPEIPKPEK